MLLSIINPNWRYANFAVRSIGSQLLATMHGFHTNGILEGRQYALSFDATLVYILVGRNGISLMTCNSGEPASMYVADVAINYGTIAVSDRALAASEKKLNIILTGSPTLTCIGRRSQPIPESSYIPHGDGEVDM